MSRLNSARLHVQWAPDLPVDSLTPRCYTLTHSDATGDLILTLATAVDAAQISGWYTRLMRDEVTAEWREDADGPALHVQCFVSGGLVLGSAAMRYAIFRCELPLVFEAVRRGDRGLFEARLQLDRAPILVHFQSSNPRYHRTEPWGTPGHYRV